MTRRVIGLERMIATMYADRPDVLAKLWSNLPPTPGPRGVITNIPGQPTMADQPKKVAPPPLPTLQGIGIPSSIQGGRKNFPPGPDRDKRDELVRSLVESGIPKDEAERAVFGDDTKQPLSILLKRADEMPRDVAWYTVGELAAILVEQEKISYTDALSRVVADPSHARLAAALQWDANGYALADDLASFNNIRPEDALESVYELNKLAREYQRTEKISYTESLRAVSADHPELVDAREALYEREMPV